MAADAERDGRVASVDGALVLWRQGDCVLGEHWFAHRLDTSCPITEAGRAAAEADADLAEQEVAGFVVVTQTCDIVRSCVDRHFVEVCPLVVVERERLGEIERGRRPAYGFLPRLASRNLVADLDRVMTVEKPLVARWERVPGWDTDAEARNFARALARKRLRFAFPDDFTALAKKLSARLGEKHGKDSGEGRALRALREIRVSASPSWDAEKVDVRFWFIRDDADASFEGEPWAGLLAGGLKLVPATGRFTDVHGQVVELEAMKASEYVDSDALDLDHLSTTKVVE